MHTRSQHPHEWPQSNGADRNTVVPSKPSAVPFETLAQAVMELNATLQCIANQNNAAIARSSVPLRSTPAAETRSLTERAITLIFAEGITQKSALARRLGVHRSSISRIRNLDTAIIYYKTMRGVDD